MGDVLAELAPWLTQAQAQHWRDLLAPGGSSADLALRAGALWVLRPEVQVFAPGTLTLAADWTLPAPVPSAATGLVQAGGAALSVRAAGSVHLHGSLSSGFAASPDGALRWAPEAARAGDIRIAAGADLQAADPLALRSRLSGDTEAAANLLIGRLADAGGFSLPQLRVRNTDGRIELRAAGHLQLAHAGASVLTLGRPTDAAGLPELGFSAQFLGLLESGDAHLSPFLSGGGAISLRAGGDLIGAEPADGLPLLPAEWWWRGSDGTLALWWSRPDRFSGGVASLGGGDLDLRAGSNVRQWLAAAAGSGWMGLDGVPVPAGVAEQAQFGGGSVSVRSGSDVLGGSFFAAGPQLTLQAGGRIGAAAGGSAPDLMNQATALSLSARGDLDVARLRSAGMTAPSNANTAGDLVLGGLDHGASLSAISIAGDLLWRGGGRIGSSQELATQAWSELGAVLPGRSLLAAPQGSLTMTGAPLQRAGAAAELRLLARDALQLSDLVLGAGGTTPALRALQPADAVEAILLDRWSVALDSGSDARGLDRSDRSVAQLASAQGDLVLLGGLQSARPLQLSAGRDLRLDGAGRIVVQHQAQRLDGASALDVSELTLLQAGRDITAASAGSVIAGITVAGPGDLVLLAGRDIDLGASSGVQAVGNQRNSALLPERGAQLTLLAGLQPGDLSAAVAGPYALLGYAGLMDRPGPVAAWLDGGDAAAFDALAPAAQWAQARRLAGPGFDAAVLHFLRSALAQGRTLGLTPAQAEAAVAEQAAALLADASKGTDPTAQAVLTEMLALPAAERPARAISWLDDVAVRERQPLASWLRSVLAQTLSLDNAFATLQTLQAPLQQQALAAVLADTLLARPQAERDAFAAAQLAGLATQPAATRSAADRRLQAYADGLRSYVQRVNADAVAPADAIAALTQLRALPLARQLPWLREVLGQELDAAGQLAATLGAGQAYDAANAAGYLSLDALFPIALRGHGGDIVTPTSQVRSVQQADISLLAPGGGINAGAVLPGAVVKKANELGIVTVSGGDILGVVREHFEVNQSRVFTLARGDILLWSSDGNVDAGRGAKTVTGAPAPVLRLDNEGQLVLDTSGSFSGSGIATLDTASAVALFAPRGEVNAGEAGISSAGKLTIAAVVVKGADNIRAGDGPLAPPPAPASPVVASGTSAEAAAATAQAAREDDEDERKKKGRQRRQLFLDFLGFGSGDD